MTGDDLHIDARIALRSATMALPVVAAGRQPVMAVSVLTCDRVLADLDGQVPGNLEEQSRRALAEAPQATEWPTSSPAGSDPPPRASAARPRPPSCRMPWRASPRPAYRTRMGCFVACWSRRSVRGVGRSRPDRGGMVDRILWVSACQRTEIRTGEA